MITGANRGLGLALCGAAADRGSKVIAVCRQTSPALRQVASRIEAGVDLAESKALSNLASRLRGVQLDTIVHNAGLHAGQGLSEVEADQIQRAMEVNAIAPVVLTRLVLGNLGAGAKVVIVSSAAGSVNGNRRGGEYGYRMSKAAVNAGGAAMAVDLRSLGVTVAMIHPGTVATRMTGWRGMKPRVAAKHLLNLVERLDLTMTGRFWTLDGTELPW